MANQHKGSFKHSIENTFNGNIESILKDLAKKQYTYGQVAKIANCHSNTARKWCYKFDIKLVNDRDQMNHNLIVKKVDSGKAQLWLSLRSSKLDSINVLS